METRPPVGTHTTTPPGATSAVGGGLAHIHQPTRRLLNTTPCCARAASCIPCLLRCNALLQQQITIAATLLSITPHNTPASCAGAFAEQTPLLPPTIRRAALSDAPARTAFLFALLNAHHVAQHVVKIAAQRHLRGDHLPRRDFRARFRARTPRATPRHLCLLRPARQQTARNISGSLLIIQHHLPSCSATACGTSEWTIFPGTTSARDFKYECNVSRRAPLASYDLHASRPSTTSAACSVAHLVIHNILHRVRHLPGGLESPGCLRRPGPLGRPCRGGSTRKHPKLTASQASEPPTSALCHDNPTPLPCVTSSRVHRLLLLCV